MINAIGSIFGSSGYDSHFRNLVNALFKLTDIRISIPFMPGWERLVNDQELEMIKRRPQKDEVNLIVTNPMNWRIYTTAKRNWAYLVWEGDKVPECFINECLNPDIEYILVPSQHTRNAIIQTIRDTDFVNLKGIGMGKLHDVIIPKIKLVPHGVDLNLFYPREKPSKFSFLMNKGFRNLEDRGGIQYGIKAYLDEFSSKEPVELAIKLNPAYGIPDLNKLLTELKPNKEDLPQVRIITDNLPYNMLNTFYNSGKVFVSPTRAESFNIPCIEAMACGLPVITTNFGGQTDFCNNETGWIISGELTEVQHELQYEGVKWLTPDLDQLKKAMREAYENKELTETKSKKALETARNYTWENSAKKIIKLI